MHEYCRGWPHVLEVLGPWSGGTQAPVHAPSKCLCWGPLSYVLLSEGKAGSSRRHRISQGTEDILTLELFEL